MLMVFCARPPRGFQEAPRSPREVPEKSQEAPRTNEFFLFIVLILIQNYFHGSTELETIDFENLCIFDLFWLQAFLFSFLLASFVLVSCEAGVEYGLLFCCAVRFLSFETGVQHGFENAFENDCGWFVSRKVAFCKPGLD